jgi:cytochrome P450
MSRDPKLWGADADEFRPERWLEGDERLPGTNRPPWCPFQFGPRTCLGMRMATCDMETVLMHLVLRFRFESAGHKPHWVTLTTLCSRNGFVLKAFKR